MIHDKIEKGHIVYVKAYGEEAVGMITDLDKDWCNIKTGYGRGSNFSLWFKDKHMIVPIGVDFIKLAVGLPNKVDTGDYKKNG